MAASKRTRRAPLTFTNLHALEESVTYQAIVEEGVAKGRLLQARHGVLVIGEEYFRAPADPGARASIEAIDDLERLEQLILRAPRVQSWDELLADVPAPRPKRVRKKRD